MNIVHALNRFPPEEGSATRVPRTVRELIEALSYQPPGGQPMFHCMQGVPRAFMEIYDGQAVMRGVYVTLLYGAKAQRADCEAELVSAMFDVFAAARASFEEKHCDHPLLFWRSMPHIEERPPHHLDKGNSDFNPLAPPRDHWLTTLRCRVWIPGVDLSGVDRSGSADRNLIRMEPIYV